jgi:hypothetical protein
MAPFANRTFIDKISDLLRTCAEWIRQHGHFGFREKPNPLGEKEAQTVGRVREFNWVYDPNDNKWVLELTYSFRSLECRLQAREAEPPSGIQFLRRLMRPIP